MSILTVIGSKEDRVDIFSINKVLYTPRQSAMQETLKNIIFLSMKAIVILYYITVYST
jgi:hypothetical protein